MQEKNTEDPTVTEIRVLDTYWSDHCRHTTFSTELKNVTFTEGEYKKPIEDTYKKYLADRAVIYQGPQGQICMPDGPGSYGNEEAAQQGKLEDQEES